MNICVFCSSSNKIDAGYFTLARDIGKALSEAGYDLVYGGGSTGIMGCLAAAVQEAGRKVIGVIPESLCTKELLYEKADELVITPDLRERKKIMADRSDVILALPGGLGTLEELLEIVTLRQLGLFNKPVAIYNTFGFYDGLLSFLEVLKSKGFINRKKYPFFQVVDDLASFNKYLQSLRK